MIWLAYIAFIAWWGLWRRCLGGFLGISRSLIFAAGALAAGVTFAPDPWLSAAGAAAVAFWAPGHKTDSWTVWLRYPGPMALGYVLGRKYQRHIPEIGGFIERGGWMAVGEIWAGACFGALLLLARGW